MVEATFTRLSRLRKVMADIMKREVSRIDTIGVLNRILTLAINEGKRLSLAMARGSREAANNPAFAVVIKASMAARESSSKPILPAYVEAPRDSGVRVF